MPNLESVSTASSRTYHPFTGADQAVMAQVRAMVERNKGKLRSVAARPMSDDIIRHTAPPDGVNFREGAVGGVSGWWAEPEGAATGRVILHLHGGWFNWGTAEAYCNLAGHIARSAAAAAFVPDYRLAPGHPFPAAGLDATATLGGVIADRAQADPFFLKDQAQGLIDAYLAGHESTDPAASPLFADPTGLPPIRLHVGDAEVLLDDAVRYGERATAAGVDAKVDVWEGMAHGFLGSVGRLQAADAALDAIGAVLRDRL